MGVSSASVTEMIQRLAARDLVTYIPYKGCRLTPKGFHLGAIVKRRQLLVEILLHDVLGIKEGIEEIACKMEHAVDDVVEEALERLFDHPTQALMDVAYLMSVDNLPRRIRPKILNRCL